MTCTHTQTLLDAYADGELSPLTVFRVRRHLVACAACTAQLADIQRLGATVHAWHNVPASVILGDRLAALLPPAASVRVPRDRRVVRRVTVGLAGIAAAIGAGLWLLPGKPSQPTLAFADVQRAMAQAQTISWNETWEFYGPAGHPGHPVKSATLRSLKWLRRIPPALASSGLLHNQDLQDSRGEFVKIAPGVYGVFPFRPSKSTRSGDISVQVADTLRQFTQPQDVPPMPPTNTAGQLTSQTRFLPTTQQRVTLGGQERILFRRVKEVTLTDARGGKRHFLFQLSLWADPKTHRVVRSESRDTQREDPEDWDIITLSDFHYDQPAPSSVFDWSPPPGAKVLSGAKAFSAMLFFGRHSLLQSPVSGRRDGRTKGR